MHSPLGDFDVGVHIPGTFSMDASLVTLGEFHLHGLQNVEGDIVLKGEKVTKGAVIMLRPYLLTRHGIGKLTSNP
jgi:hypothetical protein